MNNTQQQLPFTLEGQTSSRDVIRSIAKIADGLHKVDLSRINIREGFNGRIKPPGMSEELWEQHLMIPQLADAIFNSNGPAEPILGDFYKEDNNFYITNGERRTRALRHLMATGRITYPNGKDVSTVYVLLNPAGTTDLERKRKVISTQDNMKLLPMERAFYYLSFKRDDGMTHDQIATFLDVSRQTVDNYIKATELPIEVQEKVNNDEIKITSAINELREERKAKKNPVIVDPDSGDVLGELTPDNAKKLKEEKKPDGDEDEFLEQDNSKTFPGSMGGAKETGSGVHVIGKDSIYKDQETTARWRQFLNRMSVINKDLDKNAPINNHMGEIMNASEVDIWKEGELIIRLKNEFNLTTK